MFILHVKHYFFQEILKVHSLKKNMQSKHFITFTSGKLQDFWSSGFGFRQGLRQRSVSREALGPRMADSEKCNGPEISVLYLWQRNYWEEGRHANNDSMRNRRIESY
jgi:hypothetical protein